MSYMDDNLDEYSSGLEEDWDRRNNEGEKPCPFCGEMIDISEAQGYEVIRCPNSDCGEQLEVRDGNLIELL